MNDLEFHTVYFNPSDYPDKFVLRRSILRRGPGGISELVPDDRLLVVSDNYETIRECIPWGCVKIGPDPDDDPVIIEVWL